MACGITARVPRDTPRIICRCGFVQEGGSRPGLGDYCAAVLHRLHITPERYVSAKRWLGLTPDCGCAGRQRRLNSVGRTIAAWLTGAGGGASSKR